MQGSVDVFPLLVSDRLFAEQLEALDLGREALRFNRKPVPADPDFAALHSLGRHVQTESLGYLRRTLGEEVDVPSEHDHGFVGVQDFQDLVPTALLVLVGVELSWPDRRFRIHRDAIPAPPYVSSVSTSIDSRDVWGHCGRERRLEVVGKVGAVRLHKPRGDLGGDPRVGVPEHCGNLRERRPGGEQEPGAGVSEGRGSRPARRRPGSSWKSHERLAASLYLVLLCMVLRAMETACTSTRT